MRRLTIALALGLGVVSVAGCATVEPWQRDRLANPAMQFDPDGGFAAFRAHWQEAREGASGGAGLQGGGCGCK